jgi:GT2 family glycosyltransferase
VNQAFKATATSYVLVLNPDIRVMPGAVQLLEEFMNSHQRAGAIGGYVGEKYLPRDFPSVGKLVLENLGMRRSVGGHRPPLQSDAIPVEQPAAAALMIRREAYDDVGGFDEQFYPAWYEDVDFCQRLKSIGWDIYFAPQAEFLHEGGYSANEMGSERFARSYYSNQVRYARKHFGSFGTAAVRASIAVGMVGRMIGKPKHAAAFGKVLIGVLKGW